MEAVKKGDFGEIKRLIDAGVDVNNKDCDGRTVMEFIIVHDLTRLLERHHNGVLKD